MKVRRTLPGKRLGRITGGGLFGESQQLDLDADWREQGILGCDSVQTAVHRGRLWWAWGDTTLARYPLGLFHMTGASTELRPLAGFEPPVRLRYDYVTDEKKQPRVIAEMPAALFDLKKDPWETLNVIDDPAHAKARAEMAALLNAGWRAALPDAGR